MLKKFEQWIIFDYPIPTDTAKQHTTGLLNFTRRHDVICLETTCIDMTMQKLRVA